MSYVKELEQVPAQTPFPQQKAFLRSFVKRVEVNPGQVVLDCSTPLLPLEKNRTSFEEVLDINRIGSAYRICQPLYQTVVLRSNCMGFNKSCVLQIARY